MNALLSAHKGQVGKHSEDLKSALGLNEPPSEDLKSALAPARESLLNVLVHLRLEEQEQSQRSKLQDQLDRVEELEIENQLIAEVCDEILAGYF